MQKMQVSEGGNAGWPTPKNARHIKEMQEMQQMHPTCTTSDNPIAVTQTLPERLLRRNRPTQRPRAAPAG
jgi:hypothetical protein